ncbi:MAG: cyclodeaminase/cyclohydrolase family protein, partial [Coriobacteriales bacterium]|nr:cyclodeaminase/cyclohydrolase family protein [Coriobacteriales bacterium]
MTNSHKHKHDCGCGCDHEFDEEKCQDDCACEGDCTCDHDHDACCNGTPGDPIVSNMKINTFLDDLASDLPAPGGGGATALVGAIGTALSSMHASLTIAN